LNCSSSSPDRLGAPLAVVLLVLATVGCGGSQEGAGMPTDPAPSAGSSASPDTEPPDPSSTDTEPADPSSPDAPLTGETEEAAPLEPPAGVIPTDLVVFGDRAMVETEAGRHGGRIVVEVDAVGTYQLTFPVAHYGELLAISDALEAAGLEVMPAYADEPGDPSAASLLSR
jgi:hypothetical protein